jgi:hypothetical protein
MRAYASAVVGETDVADVVGPVDSVDEERLARLVVSLLPILHLPSIITKIRRN